MFHIPRSRMQANLHDCPFPLHTFLATADPHQYPLRPRFRRSTQIRRVSSPNPGQIRSRRLQRTRHPHRGLQQPSYRRFFRRLRSHNGESTSGPSSQGVHRQIRPRTKRTSRFQVLGHSSRNSQIRRLGKLRHFHRLVSDKDGGMGEDRLCFWRE